MTQYRISVAYDISVVLIDSNVTGAAPLPVLRRGDQDEGVYGEAGLLPFLTRALPPEMLHRGLQAIYQPGILLGETLTLEGERLPLDNMLLQVRGPSWEPRWAGISQLTAGSRPNSLQVVLADPPTETDPPPGATSPLVWAPGVYTAALLLRRPGLPDVVSNVVPFVLAPQITVDPKHAAPGDLDLTISCFPPPRASQQAFILLTGRDPLAPASLTPPAAAGDPARLNFQVPGLTAGEYIVRLRVDGVDSMPYTVVKEPGKAAQLNYDPDQKMVIA
jgi:hypothetical protein